MAESFSKYDVYATSGSMYCYAGTNVLRNDFGIRNVDELLSAMEASVFDTAPLMQALKKCVSRQTD